MHSISVVYRLLWKIFAMSFSQLLHNLLLSFIFLSIGIYILYKFKSLFKTFIKNEWLRVNVVGLLMFESFFGTIIPVFHDFKVMESHSGFTHALFFFWFFVMLNITPTINAVLAVKASNWYSRASFFVKQASVFTTIVIVPTIVTLCLNYYMNHSSTRYFKWAFSYSIFAASIVGVGYLFYAYAEYEKQQLLQSKALAYSQLNELKVQAELETLHAKINPHFLYNALNSIADLTITDGKKARQMTIALSDLFRYTLNHSNTNFATVKDEIEMAETYLQIEKIRFEENLDYQLNVSKNALPIQLPRFILQPIIENAVKHVLAGFNEKGQIKIDIAIINHKLEIKVLDNGSDFPKDLMPGYSLKIVIDKLNMLYVDDYTIAFNNHPEKHVLIVVNTNPSN